ncbi:Wadjet anti-phage system protein JetD domain-containing protein [Pseudoxanthomonas sp.]|uniref:Wadjet anti-phage system protein JetD domain-containing protein n=1 Tax=Pseudoxanthomonas sp. TaxID=1871049 RepID=UPI0028C4FCBA|nr:Wadjet anti-phage system protein JetD domain-containing protein [Pseudoxanthomonas sp.]
MSDARRVLERLLRKGERARLRGDIAPASLPMTEASAREYLALRTLAERDTFHAQVALAERAGAIAVQRDSHRGDGERLLRLTVIDLDALADHLGIALLDARVGEAADLLARWLPQFPVLGEVLDAWRNDRKVRGHGPEAAPDLADAARAVQARLADVAEERILRRESARLFAGRAQASKRLEQLTPWLDLLTRGALATDGVIEKEHVWASLGLRREPQPLLIAGSGTLLLDEGVELPLATVFLGVPLDALQGVRTTAACLLSVENLASFHDAARAPDADRALLLYTGGMPSPAWRRAYARVLDALPAGLPVWHWGDIDEGGFRIAAVLAETASAHGRRLQPWRMSPATVQRDGGEEHVPPATVLTAMCRWAERAGWHDVADDLRARPLSLEQEALPAELPHAVEASR